MDIEGKMFIEAPTSMGFNHRTVPLLTLDNPGLLMVEDRNVNLLRVAEGDLQKPDEEIMTMKKNETRNIWATNLLERFKLLLSLHTTKN
jgi:hypothetical protein